MSITIATQNRRYTMKSSEAECEQLFDQLILSLLRANQEEVKEPVSVSQEVQEVEPVELELPEEPVQEIVITPGKPEATTYRGFMYIKCPHCGEIKAFCSKEEMSFFRCPHCSEKTQLEDLTRMYLNCECGRKSSYWTNTFEELFDVNCVHCGNPVPVVYNAKKKIYETMR